MSEVLARGSLWHRWDPHIHTPGTILSNQYPANDGWEQFLARIEASDPPVRVLGITDYYSTATYESARAHKAAGRMPNVELIFPNVELRLGIGTTNGNPVNVHLLVSPEDTDHLARLHAFLANLEFEALGERHTRLHAQSLVDSFEGRDAWLRSGMEMGVNEGYAKLDELLAPLLSLSPAARLRGPCSSRNTSRWLASRRRRHGRPRRARARRASPSCLRRC